MKFISTLLASTIVSSVALAQGAVQQVGPATKFDPMGWIGDHQAEAASRMFTNDRRGLNVAQHFDNRTKGDCWQDALTSGPYHEVCIGHDASGNAVITTTANNGATPTAFRASIDGTLYDFPFTLSGIVGPVSTTRGDFACWDNTNGTLLRDCSPILNVPSLRAYNAFPTPVIMLAGYNTPGDGGGGLLYYVASDTTTADDSCSVFVDASSHRYYRPSHISGRFSLLECGGKVNDAAFDNGPIIQNAMNKLDLLGGGVLQFPSGSTRWITNATHDSTGHGTTTVALEGTGLTSSFISSYNNDITLLTGHVGVTKVRKLFMVGAGFQGASSTLPAPTKPVIQFDIGCGSCSIEESWISGGSTPWKDGGSDVICRDSIFSNAHGSAGNTQVLSDAHWYERCSWDQQQPFGTVTPKPVNWTNGLVVSANQMVFTSGFIIQYAGGGTTANPAPTVKDYGVNFSDSGGMTAQIVFPQSGAGLMCDTGCAELRVEHSDFSGFYISGLTLANNLAGTMPTNHNVVMQSDLDGLNAGVAVLAGNELTLIGNEIACAASDCDSGLSIATTANGDVVSQGNRYLPSGAASIGIFSVGSGSNTSLVSSGDVFYMPTGVKVQDFKGLTITGAIHWGLTTLANILGTSDQLSVIGNVCLSLTTSACITDTSTGVQKALFGNMGHP